MVILEIEEDRIPMDGRSCYKEMRTLKICVKRIWVKLDEVERRIRCEIEVFRVNIRPSGYVR